MPDNLNEIRDFCSDELTDLEFYRGLSERVRDEDLKKSLLRLSDVEKQHSQFWISYLQKKGVDTSKGRNEQDIHKSPPTGTKCQENC